jgi:hypothetical protein
MVNNSANINKQSQIIEHKKTALCEKVYFKQYFSYIVAVSFIVGENWSTGRKPPTCASH